MAKRKRDKTVAKHSDFLPEAIVTARQSEQVSSRGQWFVASNAAKSIRCVPGCAG